MFDCICNWFRHKTDLILCIIFSILSICLAIEVAIVTDKGMLILLTLAFSFAVNYAWDKGKNYISSGSFHGQVIIPEIPLNYEYQASIRELHGEQKYYNIRFCNNEFNLTGLVPGEYELNISGKYMHSIQSKVEIYSKSVLRKDIRLTALVDNVWHQLDVPTTNIHPYIDPTGGVWVCGINQKSHSAEYYYKDITTGEWIVYDKAQFYDILCTTFKGEILKDALSLGGIGRTVILRQIESDWSTLDAVPDTVIGGVHVNTEIALVFTKNISDQDVIIHKSHNRGSTWEVVSRLPGIHTYIRLLSLISGRLIIFTMAVHNNSLIYYSDDMGDNWVPATIPIKNNIRGFLSVRQLRNGELIASTQSGTGWKGDFHKSTVILRSKDEGSHWEVIHELDGMNSYHDFWESENGIIYGLMWPINHMVASFDRGITWHNLNLWPSNNLVPSLQYFYTADRQIYAYGLSGVYYTNIDKLNLDICYPSGVCK